MSSRRRRIPLAGVVSLTFFYNDPRVAIPVEVEIQTKNTGFRIESGMTRCVKLFLRHYAVLLIAISLLLTACGPRYVVRERRITPPEEETKIETKIEKRETHQVQQGIASWYGKDFHGRQTSSGEVYDMYQLTCAHQTLPLGTMVMVTNLENGKSVELKVNDRGPFVKGRIIDVSYAAARMLDMAEKGTAPVKVEVFGPVVEQVQKFTLQVGSFVDETNAQRLADQLRKNFENVHVTTMETQTQKYHRVRVGQFENRESASTVAEKLSLMGFNVLVTSR